MEKKVEKKEQSQKHEIRINLSDFLILMFESKIEDEKREKKVLKDKIDLQTKGKEIVLENFIPKM